MSAVCTASVSLAPPALSVVVQLEVSILGSSHAPPDMVLVVLLVEPPVPPAPPAPEAWSPQPELVTRGAASAAAMKLHAKRYRLMRGGSHGGAAPVEGRRDDCL